jgi:transcriptional regulator with XRE-family HTH domain
VKKQPLNSTDKRRLKIAQKIKQLRIAKGYTSYEQFAWDHEINRVQYWRIEKGSNITIDSLLKVLDIHKISLSEFFSDIN